VEAALASVQGAAEIDVDVPPNTRAVADARRLEQVVANLVENALVHGALPVRLDARTRRGTGGADWVEVSVLDAGAGVPDEVRPTLFSRLRTFGRPDRDRSRGTGLGLSLVRGLVEAMGGRVWYDPRPEGGSAFRFRVPAA
jgi:signal transduction histidine kinase